MGAEGFIIKEIILDDYERQNPGNFDFVYLNDGNPLVHMRHVRHTEYDQWLHTLWSIGGKTIIGASAGAMMLGNSLAISVFAPRPKSDRAITPCDIAGLTFHPYNI